MAFAQNARVRVTSQNSQWRGKLGTVEIVNDDGNHVRLDGHAVGSTVLLKDAELVASSFEAPVTYPS